MGVIGAGIIGLDGQLAPVGGPSDYPGGPSSLPGVADEAIAKEAAKVFAVQGLKIETGVKIAKAEKKKPFQSNILRLTVHPKHLSATGSSCRLGACPIPTG